MSTPLFTQAAVQVAAHFLLPSADGITALQGALTTALKEGLAALQGIAPYVVGLGLVAVALLYVGATFGPIGEWKNQNRGAFSNIMIGLFILSSVGVIITVIPTS